MVTLSDRFTQLTWCGFQRLEAKLAVIVEGDVSGTPETNLCPCMRFLLSNGQIVMMIALPCRICETTARHPTLSQ